MKYWLILIKDKERKLTCFSEFPIVPQRCRTLGVCSFLCSITYCIAYYAVKIYKNKSQRNSIGVRCKFAGWGGGGLHRLSSLSYHASEVECRVKWLMYDFIVINATMYIACITLHIIKVGSNWNFNVQSFSGYIFSSIMSIFLGGGDPTFIISYIMNQVYSACVIQCTIQIFYQYYKSEIKN